MPMRSRRHAPHSRAGKWIAAIAITLATLGLHAPAARAQQATPAASQTARAEFADSLLARMTIQEKAGQLNQLRATWREGRVRVDEELRRSVRAGAVGSFLGVHGVAATRELQRIAVEESRLGIPLLFAHDVIHGFRTIFPVPLAEASSWNTEAVERSARISAMEGAAAGLHWTYAPMVDIARDARWGRIVEGSGEDPYLGSVMAAARVRGFQDEGLSEPTTLLATAKHFAAYGAAEAGRDYNIADIPERTLREVHLPPFHAAVRAGVGSIMGGFNEIAGVPAHANVHLMRDILREEWGFEGVVVSDFTAIAELIPHGVAGTRPGAGVLALRAGVDIDMVSEIYVEELPRLIVSGRVDPALLDQAVRRVLLAKYDLGLFDDPYRYSDPARETATMLRPEHVAFARELARQSIVLLKNEGSALPLSRELDRLAVIGPLADDRRSTLGSWAAAGRPEDAVSVLEGIRAAVPGMDVRYAQGCEVTGEDTMGIAEAVRAAADADAAILVIGESHDMSGEAASRTSLELPGVQLELARAVLATGTPTVAVLMNGRPLAIDWLAENAHAIVETWFLGIQMGPAVADVLFGDHNPGGKLTVTFPRATGQVPIYYNHKPTGRPPRADDKFTSKYIDTHWTPLFPFGHGLSYTEFEYGSIRLSATQMASTDTLTVEVDVRNAGDRAGHEVVQLYIRDPVASVTRPVKELRGFRRIHLEPGRSETVSFQLSADDLAFHGPGLELVVEPGAFQVFVGTSSVEVQEASFELIDGGPSR